MVKVLREAGGHTLTYEYYVYDFESGVRHFSWLLVFDHELHDMYGGHCIRRMVESLGCNHPEKWSKLKSQCCFDSHNK
jgi:hypothetical protein